mmetsp:Transcript_101316/g.315794  ORF Transcript_101316/g.315794 Transcript_101316/m.315794 type:complete len:206 (-) Transcript_101316:1002-1619(-)
MLLAQISMMLLNMPLVSMSTSWTLSSCDILSVSLAIASVNSELLGGFKHMLRSKSVCNASSKRWCCNASPMAKALVNQHRASRHSCSPSLSSAVARASRWMSSSMMANPTWRSVLWSTMYSMSFLYSNFLRKYSTCRPQPSFCLFLLGSSTTSSSAMGSASMPRSSPFTLGFGCAFAMASCMTSHSSRGGRYCRICQWPSSMPTA